MAELVGVRPRPVADRVAETGANGVLDDVAAGRAQVALSLDRTRGEAVGEEVPEAPVPPVERLRVPALQALEPARELRPGGVEDEVVVRRHETERVNRPPVVLGARQDVGEERASIVVIPEDRASVDATRGDVEVAVRKARSQNARHAVHESARSPPALPSVDKPAHSCNTLHRPFRACPGSDPGFTRPCGSRSR
jgi:hypothetical protein